MPRIDWEGIAAAVDAGVPYRPPTPAPKRAKPEAAEPTLEPCPCDGCRFRVRCAAERLACDRFLLFDHGKPQWRWQQAPMAPTRAMFETLFGDVVLAWPQGN